MIEFRYTGNKLHPTQKPVAALAPLINVFCPQNGVVLDPFAGSGSTLVAAQQQSRRFLGFEIDAGHHRTATARLTGDHAAAACGEGAMQKVNDSGCYQAETTEELARCGRSYVAVDLCQCEDGRYRYALDMQYSYGGFADLFLPVAKVMLRRARQLKPLRENCCAAFPRHGG